MGRELRRVAMGFDWPLNQTWVGFLNPYYADFRKNCPDCSGTGNSPEGRRLSDQWYGNAPFGPEMTGSTPFLVTEPYIVRLATQNTKDPSPWNYGFAAEAQRLADHFNRSWCHHLDADDVQALVDAGRLRDLTHRIVEETDEERAARREGAEGEDRWHWLYEPTGVDLTPEMVNRWSLGGLSHDSINRWVCVEAKAKRLGFDPVCSTCKGKGSYWTSRYGRHLTKKWKKIDPPKGDGFQMWETTSEGSPISPVFATAEELARWLADTEASTFGGMTATYEQWLDMCGRGWAPDAIMTPETGFTSGVAGLAGLDAEKQ